MAVKHLSMVFAAACAAVAIVCGTPLAGAGQAASPGQFTAPQAAEGRRLYQVHCASCHMPDLSGNNDAPPLAGANFVGTWGVRSVKELFDYIAETMPPSGAALPPDTFGSIVAHILSANGATPGSQPFDGSGSASIGSLVGADLGIVNSTGRVDDRESFRPVPSPASLDRILELRD